MRARSFVAVMAFCGLCRDLAGWKNPQRARAEDRAPRPALGSAGADLANARQMFFAGVAHARQSRWELALTAFAAAYALSPQPTLLFNLATAQMRTGKLLASNANFRRFATSGDSLITSTQRRVAALELARIEARIPRLRIEIEGLRSGDRIMLDQARVYPDELGHEMWLDPGEHRVRVDRPSGDQELRTIAVSEGEVRVLAFRMP